MKKDGQGNRRGVGRENQEWIATHDQYSIHPRLKQIPMQFRRLLPILLRHRFTEHIEEFEMDSLHNKRAFPLEVSPRDLPP